MQVISEEEPRRESVPRFLRAVQGNSGILYWCSPWLIPILLCFLWMSATLVLWATIQSDDLQICISIPGYFYLESVSYIEMPVANHCVNITQSSQTPRVQNGISQSPPPQTYFLCSLCYSHHFVLYYSRLETWKWSLSHLSSSPAITNHLISPILTHQCSYKSVLSTL